MGKSFKKSKIGLATSLLFYLFIFKSQIKLLLQVQMSLSC